MHINELLTVVCEQGASDLHLKVGNHPIARIRGKLTAMTQFKRLVQEDTIAMAYAIMASDKQKAKFKESLDLDLAYSVPSLGRFRCNIFNQRGTVGLVLRVIPRKIYTIDDLMLPKVLKTICEEQRGLVLVTGTTGSGKSTTLAAMIDLINATRTEHILTIEDPIEYLHRDNLSIVNQREVEADCKTFSSALRAALRQDPDVILVGEMRDRETIDLALHAAETGHLVFSTLHTNDAKQTLDRIVDVFPAEEHSQIRSQLALCLHAVVSQRLVKRADNSGRTAAMEILINAPAIRDLIAEGKTSSIEKAMVQAGDFYRMQTFNQALAKLVQDRVVSETEALGTSSNPNDLKLMLRGVVSGARATETRPASMKITKGF